MRISNFRWNRVDDGLVIRIAGRASSDVIVACRHHEAVPACGICQLWVELIVVQSRFPDNPVL